MKELHAYIKHNMKYLTIVLFVIISSSLSAQNFRISGTVVEAGNNAPVEFATVAVKDKADNVILSGTSTELDGRFVLTTPHENVYVEVSFLGMAPKKVEEISFVNGKADLGNVGLSADGEMLDEVVIAGEKSQTVFKLDKRVFNVGTDLSSTGASALEVLNNVPSVTVNIEGQVALRGSTGVQMLVNGKPSVLASEEGNALGTITADMIEKVEVITNPSAKYDAEGTSGIINIVLKKSEKRGVNGSVTLNTGFPNNHSVGLSLNRRTEKFNLFSQLGYGYRTFPNESENLSRNKLTQAELISKGENDKNEEFYNVILGTDYHINDYNVITLSGNFAYEKETEEGFTDYTLTETGTAAQSWRRSENTSATNPKWEYELQYKRDFKDSKDRSFLFSALGNSFAKEKNSMFNDGDPQLAGNNLQESVTDFQQTDYTFKLDYTHPFSKQYTMEIGAQYLIDDVSNDFAVRNQIDGEWVNNTQFTNVFDFNQNVLGTYITLSNEMDKLGIKAGLRLENTDLSTLLQNTNESNDRNYTNLFPSAHVSYKVSEGFSLQAGYSRRIYRPRLWDLNPFFSFRNNFNLRTGNPNLLPEFTDSYEITSIYQLGELSVNAGIYHRRTTDVIERITYFEENVSTTSPDNIGTNKATGAELNAKIRPVKWLTLSTDINFNAFQRRGTFEDTSFDFDGTQWSGRLTSKWKLPADFAAEISGNYRSSYKTVQGTTGDNYFMDLGLRKKILKGKAVLNLSIRDVFASRVREFTADQPTFYQEGRSQRGRFVTFGVSYGFGKGEAMEFSGHKRF